jgi:DNA-binding GntR family transcriptional regulator
MIDHCPLRRAAATLCGVTDPSTILNRQPLRQQIQQVLLDGLVSGRWRPGDRIIERQIAAELDVSQSPVREALRELEGLRLITSVPNKGARVRELTPKDVLEFYSVRAALEELAANQAVHLLAGDVSSLEVQASGIHEDADHADPLAQIRHATGFHRAIVSAADNQLLLDMWESLGIEIWTTMSLRLFRVDLQANADDHDPIVEAFRNQDPDVGRLVREHVLAYAPSSEFFQR